MTQFSVLVDFKTQTFVVIDTVNNNVLFKTTREDDARDFAQCAQLEEETRIFAEFG